MKLDIEVKNLGKLKNGTVKLRPLTVLTGENGTGKSFFTKTLYSIFSVLNKNVLHVEIISLIKKIEFDLNIFIEQVQRQSKKEKQLVNNVISELQMLNDSLSLFKDENIAFYIKKSNELYDAKNINKLKEHLEKIANNPIKIKFIKKKVTELQNNFSTFHNLITDEGSYANILSANLSHEIKENFQIQALSELIAFDEKKCQIIDTENGLNISFYKNNFIDFSLQHNFINEIFNFDRVVFFESPTYWSVRDAFHKAKDSKEKDELTGVPKYFYDLDRILNSKLTNPPLESISELAAELKLEIGGEFKFENGILSFSNSNGVSIDKNLISFGMTNLGMVQVLLKNNVISKGSFVFFDEPETNLHPSWQVVLTKVLIKLAESKVNVVMATHSLDMIKALEVHTKEKDSDFIAVNHFTKSGGLFKFDSDDITENLIESREELSSAYINLYKEDAENG